MKKFIQNIIWFTLFSTSTYVILLIVSGNMVPDKFLPNLKYKIGSPGHLYTRLAEVKLSKDVDILFLGSSHAYRGFDTRIFKESGFNSFNLGSGAQTPIQTLVLLKRYYKKLNPKLVVFEVYPEIFGLDGVEASLDLISNDANDKYSWEMAFNLNHTITYNSLIYATIKNAFDSKVTFVEPRIKNNDKYVSGGYVEKDMNYKQSLEVQATKKIYLKKEQIELFEECLNFLKSEETNIILVYAPISKTLYSSYENSDMFDSTMERYSEYINFNKILSLNDSIHFYDLDHMNQKGVEIFNKKLIQILKD